MVDFNEDIQTFEKCMPGCIDNDAREISRHFKLTKVIHQC